MHEPRQLSGASQPRPHEAHRRNSDPFRRAATSFRGLTAPASLKLLRIDAIFTFCSAAFRGLTAPASLKHHTFPNFLVLHICFPGPHSPGLIWSFRGLTAPASLKQHVPPASGVGASQGSLKLFSWHSNRGGHAFRGLTAPASLKLAEAFELLNGSAGAFRGLTAPASLKLILMIIPLIRTPQSFSANGLTGQLIFFPGPHSPGLIEAVRSGFYWQKKIIFPGPHSPGLIEAPIFARPSRVLPLSGASQPRPH